MKRSTTTALDPVTLEVLWNRLLSVCNEQQAAVMRTAFADTVVRDRTDLACGVFDTRAQMIAQSLTGTPGHINPMATGVRTSSPPTRRRPLQPGDVLITNDPWMTSGQLNDSTADADLPRGPACRLLRQPLPCGRHRRAGFPGEAHEIYEEGLRVPVTKLFDRGEPNAELWKIIRANVRLPDETVGDPTRRRPATTWGRALLQMMDEFGLESIDASPTRFCSRSERALREAIAPCPTASTRSKVWSDGFESPSRSPSRSPSAATRSTSTSRGSSPPSGRGVNVVSITPTATPPCLEGGGGARRAARRRRLPPGARLGAGRLHPQLHRAGGGGGAASGRPFRAQRRLPPSHRRYRTSCWRAAPTPSGSASGAASTRNLASPS